jgi:penicillin amidase
MKQPALLNLLIIVLASCQSSEEVRIPGLQKPVEIIRDPNGVNHIYAENEHDLFFAQGYAAAKDRLFQFEVWRRQATGTFAEILGPGEIKRDIGARLFKFRGDVKKEFNHYHPHGEEIINAFTEGVNAYIAETESNPALLPLEFKLLGIKPAQWSPEIVISRHQGLLGNLPNEIATARAVVAVGADIVKQLNVFEPGDPNINLDPKIRQDLLMDSITELYDSYRRPNRFNPKDLVASANQNKKEYDALTLQDERDYQNIMSREQQTIGSNNWVVNGSLSQTGFPLLANDPHRTIAIPSLRYMVHLVAPGWNVVGGGEPTIPGISIGHNEFGAWGLTIFSIDGEDIYVYELNPVNQNQYKYGGKWEDMKIIPDTIMVKGADPVLVNHRFTRHGPVTLVDKKKNVAYAIRCAWMEPGGAPYMASLRIDQATNWDEFCRACTYSNIPAENMIWADKKGNIGWQAVGIAPIRKNWSGLVPVPGDGTFEWEGYLPITTLPSVYNPSKGFWATANENLVPENYGHRDAVGWSWASPFRANRINEVLGSGKKHSMEDMMRLQFDYLSTPARALVPLLKDLHATDPKVKQVINALLQWNFVLDKNSIEAGIYMAWEKKISSSMASRIIPPEVKKYIRSIPLSKIITWVVNADPVFGNDPFAGRNEFLLTCIQESLKDLETSLGPDMKQWRYGQPSYHHILLKHPLSNAVDEVTRKKLELGPLARGGSGTTAGMTTNANNQTSGASFRMVTDVSDWDKTMFTNTPGQSGNPDSPYYSNLFEAWANDKHFPVYFSKPKVEATAKETTRLVPSTN